jgi:hypothetical protein
MTDNLQPPSSVYAAIAAITAELAKAGIAKDRKASTGGASYNFRGIDDVYNALAPLLAEHKLCILPQVCEREVIERQSRSGGALFYVTVKVKFDFVSAEDGSCHEVITLGEAMDSGDKATNKAMSAAYKYAAMMAFCIPTLGAEGEEDTHEVTVRKPRSDRGKPHRGTDRYAEAFPQKVAGEQLAATVYAEAERGTDALRAFWSALLPDDRRSICLALDSDPKHGCPQALKDVAERADQDIKEQEQPT